jgi:hypothetical protein
MNNLVMGLKVLVISACAGALAGTAAAKPAEKMKEKPTAAGKNWQTHDGDASGSLSEAEFVAFKAAGFSKMDVDGDGALTQTEFATRGKQQSEESKTRLTEAFAKLDKDADGSVSLADLDAKSKREFKKFDADANGEISPDDAPKAFK